MSRYELKDPPLGGCVILDTYTGRTQPAPDEYNAQMRMLAAMNKPEPIPAPQAPPPCGCCARLTASYLVLLAGLSRVLPPLCYPEDGEALQAMLAEAGDILRGGDHA